MHIEVEQTIDFRLAREFDAALYRHDTHRAVRFRPVSGFVLMALAIAWMLNHASGGVGVVAVAFLFFWGCQLALVELLKRFWGFFRLARALGLGRAEVIRLDSIGATQSSDRALLQAVRWHKVDHMVFCRSGVLLAGEEIAPMFLSARNVPSQAMNDLKQFLVQEWPDRVRA